ncbi:MAG: polysaccharide biosynthesis protein [Ruminococcus sp.]|nr:polysaccharide biosynthesis protein [Ruminococcus sp.]
MKTFNAKKIILMIADILMIFIFGFLTNLVLMWFDIGTLASESSMLQISWSTFTLVIAVEMLFCFLTLNVSGTYAFFWRLLGKHEYLSCFIGFTAGMMLSVGFLAFFGSFDESSPVVFFVVQFLLTCVSMMLFRYFAKKAVVGLTEAGRSENYQRTLIIGAGRAATLLLTDIENAKKDPANPSGNMLPVGLVDDDRSKLGSKILGVPVLGGTVDIPALCEQSHISLIVFAIPSCTEEDRQRILSLCSKTQCKIKMVPYLSQLLFEDGGHPQLLNQVKDIHIEDLLGREPITFDKEQTKEFIRDKVLMVTGGGGSIGSELVRQIAKYNPRQVIIVDIYENNAYDIQQELILEYGDEVDFVTLIASVRDFEKMNLIFEKYRPQVVFHAAAHKHVPLMETSPEEAVKNNVFGTFNIAKLAENYGVEKFIMISTDKAVNPTNVMGATKRCCEMIVQYMSQHAEKTDFVTTRFGNVLGSNGSVIPLFRRQIESGKPVTVTHPDIIRYFMTIPEAVSLVLQAGAMAQGGEIFVLDMGEPVKITTLAENLIRMYGKVPYRDVEIKFTGLRPGEKLFEELLMNEEGLKSTENKKIFIVVFLLFSTFYNF